MKPRNLLVERPAAPDDQKDPALDARRVLVATDYLPPIVAL
jgi:hypothetical protein